MPGKPKPAFYVVLALIALGLVAFALYRMDVLAPKGKGAGSGDSPVDKLLKWFKGNF